MGLFRRLMEKFYQADVREVGEYSKFLFEENKKGRILLGDLTITKIYLIGGLIAITTGLTTYLIWDWWNKHKDSDGDGIPDFLETSKYHTDPFNKDTDEDGLNDKFEIDNGLDPLKPNPVYAYLRKIGKIAEYRKFEKLDNENFDENGKELIDYYLSLPSEYRENSTISSLLKQIVSDGKVSREELMNFKDWDSDGLENLSEVENNLDPLKPNPVYAYLKKNGLLKLYDLFKSLENDSKLDENEESLIDYYASLGDEYKNNEFVLDLLKKIVDDGKVSSEELENFKDWDGDGLENLKEIDNYKTDPFKPNPNISYVLSKGFPVDYLSLVRPLDEDGEIDDNEKKFDDLLIASKDLLVIDTLLNYLREISSDGSVSNYELNRADNFSSLVRGLFEVIDSEKLAKDKIDDTDYASQLGLKLGFDERRVSNATIFALGEYAIAVNDLKLPLEFDALRLLTRCTQVEKYGSKLVDSSPIVFHSVDGNDYVIEINTPRNVWMLAKHLYLIRENGFDIEKHPEMFEGINGKIIANAWSLFDAKYGISFSEREKGRIIKPSDKDVWDLIILQWDLYSNFTPQLGGGDKLYNRDFPWYDSDLLDELYPDVNTRRQALLFLFYLPNATFDMEKQKVVCGLEGSKTALLQAFKEYEKIVSLYPKGILYHEIWGDVDTRFYYYDWVVDRCTPLSHPPRLVETGKQFTGIYADRVWKIITQHPKDFWNYLKIYNGLDQFLTENWKYWDLVKFVAGYERWNPKTPEIHTINYTIPQTLQMFGFPVSRINQDYSPPGAIGYEWAVSLPQYVVDGMVERFGDRVVIGAGNLFGLYSCKEGLVKDGATQILVRIPYEIVKIYLFRRKP